MEYSYKNPISSANNLKLEQQKAELKEKFSLEVEISQPFPVVKEDWNNQPMIGYKLTYKKGNRTFETEYFLGIGHVKYGSFNSFVMGFEYQRLYHLMKQHKNIKAGNEMPQAEIATKLAKYQGVKPNPIEVLYSIVRDATEATNETFENWAVNLGYDEDSRKGEKIYNTSRDYYPKLLQILTAEQMETFQNMEF